MCRQYIVADVKNKSVYTSLKNVTKQISNIHIRCRTVLTELAAVNLLTEAVSFFNGVSKQRSLVLCSPLVNTVPQIPNQLLLL